MPRKPRQIPLQFSHAPATTRDDLVISDPVSTAIGLIDRWPDWPSPVVILTGPTGAGKSHLAAVWHEKSGATALSPQSFDEATAIAAAARGAILIEDVDRGGFPDQALFHLINTVREHGTSLLMTTRMWPSAWNVALPDLRSRLKAATVVEIGEPDDELLAQVIVKLFSDRQIANDPRIVGNLVARMERSLYAAQRIVERIDELAMARGTKIGRALAAEALAEFGGHDIEGEPS
jgi:chromosomal replication initiation ATPase DnaA